MTFRAAILIGLLFVSYGLAQSERFEVASIKPHTGIIIMSGLDISGSRVTISASTVSSLIASAYGLKDYQLEGASEWMQSERYDIAARAPGDRTPTNEEEKRMLQALLAERFQLKAHTETREKSVYALIVGKSGSKLKENPAGNGVTKFNRTQGRDVEMVFTPGHAD